MAKTPRVGQLAPDVDLPGLVLADEPAGPDQPAGDPTAQRTRYRLSEQRGRPMVLAFYPGDDTPTCTRQMCAYSAGLEQFTGFGALVWGISRQDLDSHERFARGHDLRFPLLSDTDGAVVARYGIGLPGLGLRRAVFVVDGEGVVRWRHVALVGLTYQDLATVTEQLALLTGDTAPGQ